MASQRRWRLNQACHVLWRHSDDGEYILYNISSSQTHYLNELGAEALRQLEHQSFSAPELLAHFAAQYENFASDIESSLYVQELLADLDNLGLIEPCPE